MDQPEYDILLHNIHECLYVLLYCIVNNGQKRRITQIFCNRNPEFPLNINC